MKLILMALIILPLTAYAKLNTQSIAPDLNDAQIRQAKGPHLALFDDEVVPNRLLFIAIGGTNSTPAQYSEVLRIAASLGYDVLSVDYPNEVISTVCRERATELDCYDNYRAEIVLGQQLSSIVQVDQKNSILNRIQDLLTTVARKNSARWSSYFQNGQIDWSRVVLAGHSQGSGHAVYLSKMFSVKGVIMTGGPQDYLAKTGPVAWIQKSGKTESSRYFSFLHRDDFFGSEAQIYLARLLLGDSQAPLARVQDTVADDVTAHIILSELQTADPHNALLRPIYPNIWNHLLKSAAQAGALGH